MIICRTCDIYETFEHHRHCEYCLAYEQYKYHQDSIEQYKRWETLFNCKFDQQIQDHQDAVKYYAGELKKIINKVEFRTLLQKELRQ
jgi:hypothetical protein